MATLDRKTSGNPFLFLHHHHHHPHRAYSMSGISVVGCGSPSPLISTLQFPLLCCHTSTHTFGNIDLFLGFAATHLYSKELPLTLPEFTPTHDSFTRFCASSCPSTVHMHAMLSRVGCFSSALLPPKVMFFRPHSSSLLLFLLFF